MQPGKNDSPIMDTVSKETLDRFKQLKFKDEETGCILKYNLYVPPNAPANLPLVMFMGDARTVGPDATLPLRLCLGARVWTEPEFQANHSCIVLVPQFSQVAVNDNWERTQEVDVIPRLLSKVVQETSADRNHLYTTGQSMGGMISLYLSATHPTLFAASLFVACQWDASILAPLGKQRFLYIVAGGDQKASRGMEELKQVMQGFSFSMAEIDPRSPLAERDLSLMLFDREISRRIFLTFPKGAVLPTDGSGHEHVCSFDHAYRLHPVLEWLLARPLKSRHHSALRPLTTP